jgi:hypothetical protein
MPFARIAAALLISVLLQACESLPRLEVVPSTLTDDPLPPASLLAISGGSWPFRAVATPAHSLQTVGRMERIGDLSRP